MLSVIAGDKDLYIDHRYACISNAIVIKTSNSVTIQNCISNDLIISLLIHFPNKVNLMSNLWTIFFSVPKFAEIRAKSPFHVLVAWINNCDSPVRLYLTDYIINSA